MNVRCNWCVHIFDESEIIYDEDEGVEYCPHCHKDGYLMDLEEDEEEE